MPMNMKSVTFVAMQKVMLAFLLFGLLPACGWFRSAPHLHHEPHRHEDAKAHDHGSNAEDLWSETEYPSSDNMYRLMGQILANQDTADHGQPSRADMFIANFSEAYHPFQADSLTLVRLKAQGSGWRVYVSASCGDEQSRVFVPRLARLLDQLRFDSAALFYRGLGLNGQWLETHTESFFPDQKMVPYACITRHGKVLGILSSEDRNRLGAKLLDVLSSSKGN